MKAPALVISLALWTASFWSAAALSAASPQSSPHLERRGAATQLIVDGHPYLALAGELHNSSSTSRAYMQPLWPKLAQMNLNTVLAAVPWELIEPEEGKFDFTVVDNLVEDARANHLRLVLLWFGSWKNGLSHYVPEWVKSNSSRFPRVLTRDGTLEILTPLSDANRDADAKAFAAMMRHLKGIDAAQSTVLMVQVENEVGLHGDARDRSAISTTAFAQPVPRELMEYLRKNRDALLPATRALWQPSNFRAAGTWEEVFGHTPAAEEAFMAWNYARYVNDVAEAGKNEYALPMFVNAWIVQPQDEFPGDYPSGGPQAHVHDFWKAGAPHIDILAPDIYLPNFAEVCAQYAHPPHAFFIPESRPGVEGVANAFLAIGSFNSIGYSPFGIDSPDTEHPSPNIPRTYALLREIAPIVLEAQARGLIAGVSLTPQNTSRKILLGNYVIQTSLPSNRRTNPSPERGTALIISLGPDEFLVAGTDIQLSFATVQPGDDTVGLASVEEGTYESGRWMPGRNLNGDEVMLSYDMPTNARTRQSGTGLRFTGPLPTLQKVKLYRFPQSK